MTMAEEEDTQYLFEIQEGVEGSTQEEVMVILDLDGQDLPDSVTQAIIYLAQNSQQPISSVRVTKAHKKLTTLLNSEAEKEVLSDEENFRSFNLKAETDVIHSRILASSEENFSQSMIFTGDANIYNEPMSGNHGFQVLLQSDEGIYQTSQLQVNQTNILSELANPAGTDHNDKGTSTGDLSTDTRIVVKDLIQLEDIRTGKFGQSIRTSKSKSPTETKNYLEIKSNDIETCTQDVPNFDKKLYHKEKNNWNCPSHSSNTDSTSNFFKDSATKRKSSESLDNESNAKNIQEIPEKVSKCENGNFSTNVSLWESVCVTDIQSDKFPSKSDVGNNVLLVEDHHFRFSCSLCSFQCQNDIDLGRHLKAMHFDQHPFKCSVCKKSFSLELSFKIHKLSHGDETLEKKIKAKAFIDCPHCSQSFTTTRRVLRHVSKVHGKLQVFFCEKCKMSFKSKSEVDKHLLSSSHLDKVNKVTECPVCHISCVRLSKHLSIKHPTYSPFLCDLCGYSCKIYAKLKTHILSHLSEKSYQCPHCHKYLKSKVSWNRHVKNHNSEKKFSCNQCNFRTNDSYEYKKHVQRVHSKKLYYDCKFCNLSFLKANDLKVHAMSEHKSKDTQFCCYCNFSCETRAELKKHQQIHTGKHPYVCETCGFSTAFKAHLDRHQSTHSNLKPYKCPECDYSCKEKVNLKKHMVTHRPEKPFACPMCPHRCKLRSLLNSHIRIVHSSLRPYSCSQCDYTCKTPSNLRKHQWIHQGYKPFACRFCPYITCETNKLRRHERFKHRAQIEAEVSSQEKVVESCKTSLEPVKMLQEESTYSKVVPKLTDTAFAKGLFRLSNSLDFADEDMGPVVEKTFYNNGRVSLTRLQENTAGEPLTLSMNPPGISPQPQRFIIQYSD